MDSNVHRLHVHRVLIRFTKAFSTLMKPFSQHFNTLKANTIVTPSNCLIDIQIDEAMSKTCEIIEENTK